MSDDMREILSMCNPDYLDVVDVACYALERGFRVRYEGQGNLIVQVCNTNGSADAGELRRECNTEVK